MKTKREIELERQIERLEARKRERALERRLRELQAEEEMERAVTPSETLLELLRLRAPQPVVVPIYVPMPAPVQVNPTWIPGEIICSVSDRTH